LPVNSTKVISFPPFNINTKCFTMYLSCWITAASFQTALKCHLQSTQPCTSRTSQNSYIWIFALFSAQWPRYLLCQCGTNYFDWSLL